MVQGDTAKGTHQFLLALAPDKASFSSLSVPMFSFLIRMSKVLLCLLSCPISTFGCLDRLLPRTVPFPQSSGPSVGQLSAVNFHVNSPIKSFSGVRNTFITSF